MMAAQGDYYEILGVSRDASPEEVRKAYLKKAHKYHPDKTGGDKVAEDKLKEVNAAYDTLKNSEKRAQYDQFGHGGDPFASAGAGAGGFGFGGSGGSEAPFEDLFDALFGGGRGTRRRASAPGRDLEYRFTITLADAAFGTKKEVRFPRMENCGDCGGNGAAPGSKPEACPDCGGSGQVRQVQGFFSVSRTCGRCRGAGRIVTRPCGKCSGSGQVRAQRTLHVDIPAGVDTGSRIRLAGEGEAGIGGGPRGDLYIRVEVEEHEIFHREGNDIICEVPVSFSQAALGATIRVPTLGKEADLKIPAGTQSGQQLRLRGMGIPDVRGYRQGDQIVCVHVETPSKLSREQKELLKKFDKLSGTQTYPRHRRFVDALKQYLGRE